MSGTPALPIGTVLRERYEIQSVAGRGGFSIAYLASDITRRDECIVKELAPTGAQRSEVELDLSTVPSTNPQRLIRKFIEEAQMIAKLRIQGILRLRDSFEELGTAFYVTDTVRDGRPLDSVLSQEGRLASETAQEILFQLMDILQAVHSKNVLHRDIKPANIILSRKGEAFLIDFGSAREWHADSAALQTLLFTPGYAPLEQLSDRGRRGPATDIYALCATAYHMLVGYPPRPAAERADGTEMEPLAKLRPDLDVPLVQAITAGLEVRFQDRPQSIEELRSLFLVPDEVDPQRSSLESFDAVASRLETFSFDRYECPVCGGLLERPKALKSNVCPVCRAGAIKKREIHERACAKCHSGVLHHRGGKTPLLFCPQCRSGLLVFQRKGILSSKWHAHCPKCDASFAGDDKRAALECAETAGERSWSEWLALSCRSSQAWICDTCDAQYDVVSSGKWRAVDENGRIEREFYPDEWARLAIGLKPDAGNAFCDGCGADFWRDKASLTLLAYTEDPFGYAASYADRILSLDQVPWLATGKVSENPGLLCSHCETEFDENGDFYALVRSPSPRLARCAKQSLVMEDWHRLAKGLPIASEEPQFFNDMASAIANAYVSGEISFDSRDPSLLWSGQAKELLQDGTEWKEAGDGTLSISTEELIFGRMFRKWRVPFTGILRAHAEGDDLFLTISGSSEPRIFELQPAQLTVHLNSGDRTLSVGAELLARALKRPA